MAKLIITADDFGLDEHYDAGIVEAAAEGLIDAVGVMVGRRGVGERLADLKATDVELGLHLELHADGDAPRAGDSDRQEAEIETEAQLGRFEALAGRPPAFLDGHHHCHARAGLGVVVSDLAVDHGLVVRSVDPRHRRLLRCRGVATPDLLVGRYRESDPVEPGLPEPTDDLVVEWMVHPGHRAPEPASSYDAGREEDLEFLRAWDPPSGYERATHREAFGLDAATR